MKRDQVGEYAVALRAAGCILSARGDTLDVVDGAADVRCFDVRCDRSIVDVRCVASTESSDTPSDAC